MLSLKREESSILEGVEEGEPLNISSVATPATDSVDSQTSTSSTDSLATSASFASTGATSVSGAGETTELSKPTPAAAIIAAPEGVPYLLRLRTALNFITTSYLPSHLHRTLSTLLQTQSPAIIDFTPLDQHLSHIADLRQQALASRSLGDYSRKRALDEDEETRADKKRRKDEEEKKRKAGESRGVRELKKVNVKGMKKMSDFFAKKS
jgi:Ydr279p protein family (RNase H2 complex component) wHTH domain